MAERDATSAVIAAANAGTVRPVFFYEGEYVSLGVPAFVRLWTGVGTYAWDGKSWLGGGQMLSISSLEETSDLKAVGFSVRLSGAKSELISIALQSMRQNRPGKIWIGFFDAAGALIADPYMIKRGLFNIAPIQDNGADCIIEVQYEDRLIALERPRERRYTPEDQALDRPGDRGFDQVTALQDIEFLWGR